MTLYFVGMGLHDHRDLTLKGLEVARSCDKVYVELYTSLMAGLKVEDLEGLLGRRVTVLSRSDLEGRRAVEIVEEASRLNVALLVPGDPFIATTHVALRVEAMRRGVDVKVVHGASIASAAPGLTGLSFYKFGRSVTVVYPEPGYMPEAPYDVLRDNASRGLHTLMLLDIKAERGAYMTVPEALRLLMEIEERRGEGVVDGDMLVVGVARAGSMEPSIAAGGLMRVLEVDLGPPPHTLIVPGELHFMEEEALISICGVKREEVEAHRRWLHRLKSRAREAP